MISIMFYVTMHGVQDILLKADSHLACQTPCFLYGIRMFTTVLTEARH